MGIHKSKYVRERYPDPKLMRHVRLLPSVQEKYINKKGIELTNMIGVIDIVKRKKMRIKNSNGSSILKDSISDASIIKYIPQDERLQTFEIKYNTHVNIDTKVENKIAPNNTSMHKIMDGRLDFFTD